MAAGDHMPFVNAMIWEAFAGTMKILTIVFVLMVIVEYLMLRYKKAITSHVTGKPFTQYVFASMLGAIPGCIDAFFIVSLYISGIVGFGALVAVMLSTAGDEAFVMLAMFPDTALLIFGICIILGIIGGFLADKLAKALNLHLSKKCQVVPHKGEMSLGLSHFIHKHVWEHIVKKHMLQLFLWLFFTLLAMNWLTANFDLQAVIPQNRLLMLLFAALIGVIPESGPHLIFVVMFAQGLIPFSVLLVSTLSQDGHGLLPLLSYSVEDTIYVQIFTTLFAVAVGLVLFALGF